MLQTIEQSQTTPALRRVYFWLLDVATGTIGQTGKTPAIRVAKNDDSNAAAAGAVTEVDVPNLPGLYYYTPTQGEVDTLGTLVMYITEASSLTRRIHATITEEGPTTGSPAAGTIMGALGDIEGTGFAKDTHSLTDIQADTSAIDGRLPADPADQSAVEAAIVTSESNIRGSDGDDLKDVSDQLDALPTAAAIDTQLSGTHGIGSWESGAGSGANIVTLMVRDDVTLIGIPDVIVQVFNESQTTLLCWGMTDSNGQVVFSLDDGTYKVMLRKLGSYTFDLPETLVVSGATTDTYDGTAFSPSTPPSPDTCVVFGWEITPDGVGAEVEVEAEILASNYFLQTNPHVIRKVTTTSDPNHANGPGYWELVITKTVEFAGTEPVHYKFTIDDQRQGDYAIPDDPSIAFKLLVIP